MIIRYLLNRNSTTKCSWFKFLVWQRSRQFSVQYTKSLIISRPNQSLFHTQIYGKRWISFNTEIHYWKWLIAISLLHAGDNIENIYELINHGSVKDLHGFLEDNPKDVNKCHEFGWTPLHVAAANDKFYQLEVLLKCGADPSISECFSNSYQVARKLKVDINEVIFEREKDFTKQLSNTALYQVFTALHYAALLNNKKSLCVLLSFGANLHLKSVTGHRPIDLCSDLQIYQLLLEYQNHFDDIKKLKEAEERKNFPLELRLKQKLFGQENAIKVVVSAIRCKENGWTDDEHPLVFLFLGSSGIGKTELAKQIASYIHKDNKDGFIRLDMSEYQTAHEVSKMIGSPPGYVGYDDGGYLTKMLKKNPNAVVLFDEVDKAHRDVLTVLQLFDETMKKHKVKLEWDSAVEHVLIGAYDASYGARSIKHEVERSVISQIAKTHEKGVINEDTVVKIAADITKGENGSIFLKILYNNKYINVDEIA